MPALELPFIEASPLSERLVRSRPSAIAGAARNAPTRYSSLSVEVCGLMQAGDHDAAWRGLALRSLERNSFYEPDFALAAARHLRSASRPLFVMIRDLGLPPAQSLFGMFPVVMPRASFGSYDLFGWRHDQLALGTPLIDAERAPAVIATFFGWLSRQSSMVGGVMLPFIPEEGPTAAALKAFCEATGRTITRFGTHERAVLRAAQTFEATLAGALPGKKIKELRRLRRRLEEKGEVSFVRHTDPRDVRDATELFLALEAKGWKGRNGTAFLQNATSATFLRSVTRSLAQRGECSVDVLRAGDAPAAIGLVIGSTGRSFYWKTTFDEDLASYSPGVQLTLELSAGQVGAGVVETDSCAIADHPMIDRLWPDRLAVSDWLVAARPDSPTASFAAARESARRTLRSTAKSLYRFAKGQKP